jgi:heme/copper-type cytochrome/quinol oxidase subunit 3
MTYKKMVENFRGSSILFIKPLDCNIVLLGIFLNSYNSCTDMNTTTLSSGVILNNLSYLYLHNYGSFHVNATLSSPLSSVCLDFFLLLLSSFTINSVLHFIARYRQYNVLSLLIISSVLRSCRFAAQPNRNYKSTDL